MKHMHFFHKSLLLLKSALEHPDLKGRDIDAPETTRLRHRVIQQKPFLKKLYMDWYDRLAALVSKEGEGPVLEIGSGGGFLQETIHELIRSDVFFLPNVDLVLDGGRMPFRKGGLQGIAMLDVFHHLPDVGSFLKDAARCVPPGGFICMIEPWVTPWSKLIYRYLHHEPFDPAADHWRVGTGKPLSESNQALAWMVFKRDVRWFEKAHPEWRIRQLSLHTPFAYLLSGGVSLRSLIPAPLFKPVKKVEQGLSAFMETWAMFATIILVRIENHESVKDNRP